MLTARRATVFAIDMHSIQQSGQLNRTHVTSVETDRSCTKRRILSTTLAKLDSQKVNRTEISMRVHEISGSPSRAGKPKILLNSS